MIRFPIYVLICISSLIFQEITAQIEDVQHSARLNQLVFSGQLIDAESEIQKLLADTSVSKHLQSELLTLGGFVHKLRGNMERAIYFWKQSNTLRRKLYPLGDYRLAWNYALLSNYHYEMIETKQAIAYADSCSALIANLTIDQQLELEIYRIWNILAQSYKSEMPVGGHFNYEHKREIYQPIIRLYEQSMAFQTEHHTPLHYLAKTYHLFANAHLDLSSNIRNVAGQDELKQHYFNTADRFYAKAIAIWQELYGDVHYEHGKTRFLKAMLHHRVRHDNHPGNFDEIFRYYEEALAAFGLEENPSEESLRNVLNKVDLLMCLRLYTMAILLKQEKEGTPEILHKAEEINTAAIKLWKIVHEEFNARQQNLALSLYHLVPFEFASNIEYLKYQLGKAYSFDKMFEANQYLKYYDLQKDATQPKALPSAVSIVETQQKLSKDEWFIDFFDCGRGAHFALAIDRDTVFIYSLPGPMREPVRSLNHSIVKLNTQTFVELSHQLYNDLLGQLPNLKGKRLIICPQEYLNQLPVETLLVTPPTSNETDYRQFDYLLHHCEIEYALSAATFRKHTGKTEFAVSAFAPDYSGSTEYSALPFSQNLVKSLSEKGFAHYFQGQNTSAEKVLQSTLPVLHLSAHGLIEPEHSEFSNLVLNDGFLNLNDVYAHRTQARLVVLNTCNSSLGTVLAHDGINGFARAFLSAGAASVLTNLWEVDDRVSNQLLEHFYDQLHAGQTSTSALRAAQLKQIEQASTSDLAAPYYWAGHRLVGDELRFSQNVTSEISFSVTAILLLVITAAGIGIWRLRKF